VTPINEFKAGSPNKTAFDAAFLGHFGFTKTDPAAANITSTQMDTFLDTMVEPQFLGAGWSNWSNASSQPVVSRIALNETAETSVSANQDAFKKLAMASATITDLFSGNINAGARGAIVTRAIELVGEALGATANIQSQTGIAENRVKRASERLDMQIDLFERNVMEMEGVDSYEASNRVKALLSQIEASYMLTANIRQLSLMKFLT
jgi:flagellar hook-associated protein 3 FlgL